jgi:hypothetical protein
LEKGLEEEEEENKETFQTAYGNNFSVQSIFRIFFYVDMMYHVATAAAMIYGKMVLRFIVT